MQKKIYDIAIIGGGPAGLTAGIYSARAMYETIMVTGGFPGGQIMQADTVENYPGFPEAISGLDLGTKMYEQADRFGMNMFYANVTKIEQESDIKVLITDMDTKIYAKTVIIASGASAKKLDVKREELFLGKGVSYCATCDGALFKEKEIAVVGGGDTAVEDAVFLTKFARKVHIVHRRDKFRASKIVQMRAFDNDKIQVHWNSAVDEIIGEEVVTGLKLKNTQNGSASELSCDGVFILIGTVPNSDFVKPFIKTDENGYIFTDYHMATNITGIYAAGDVIAKDFRQVATAVGDGANAYFWAERYLEGLE